MNNPHLTLEQLYDLLDQPALAKGTHLHVCPSCQEELATLRSSLDNFRGAATGLAAAEMPPLRRKTPARAPGFAFRRQVFAASMATAAVLLAASVTLLHPHRPAAPVPVSTAVPQPASAVSDAALLDGIQQDLSASVPPSMAPLEVAPSNPGSLDHQN